MVNDNKFQISDFIQLLNMFLEITPELTKLFIEKPEIIKEIEPWHQYYEISHHLLLNKNIKGIGFKPETLQYIFSENPIQTIHEISKQETLQDEKEDINLYHFISLLYPLLKSKESVFYYQQTIHQLLKKIEDGFDPNDNLLQHILSIDKTAIHCKAIQKRIQKAQLLNDEKLFRKISNALKPREKPKHSEDSTLTFIIFFLMDNGHLQAMSEVERYQALQQFKSPHINKDSFIRKTYRIMELY